MAAQSNTRRRAPGSSIALLLLVGVATTATATLYDCSSGSRHPFSGHSLHVPISLNFYGERRGSLYVSVDGIVQFGNPPEDKVSFGDNGGAFIAPFNGDLFVSSTISYKPYYCTGNASSQSASIARAKQDIQTYTKYASFEPEHLVIATWNNTGYHDKCSGELNLFQCVIASNEEKTFVLFIYDKLSWCPERSVRVGFKNGTSVWEMPCSGKEDIITLVNTSNVGVPGLWVFRVDQDIEPACPVTDECGKDGVCSCLQSCDHSSCQCKDSCTEHRFCQEPTLSSSYTLPPQHTSSFPRATAIDLRGHIRHDDPATIYVPIIIIFIIIIVVVLASMPFIILDLLGRAWGRKFKKMDFGYIYYQ